MKPAWQSEAEDIGGEVNARPRWMAEGTPMCARSACPRWVNGQGCDTMFPTSDVCTPVVCQMAAMLDKVKR